MHFLSVIVLLVSAIANGLLLVALIPFLRGRFLDHPNDRSSHIAPTPRGGGLVLSFWHLLQALYLFFLDKYLVVLSPCCCCLRSL